MSEAGESVIDKLGLPTGALEAVEQAAAALDELTADKVATEGVPVGVLLTVSSGVSAAGIIQEAAEEAAIQLPEEAATDCEDDVFDIMLSIS